MLYVTVLALLALVKGQYFGPTLVSRQFHLIDTCVNISDGAFGSSTHSEICHCSDRSVHCNQYYDTNCTDYESDTIAGGCSTYIYRVDNCAAAQEVAANGDCPYWVDTSENYYPLYYCRDYNCGGGYLSCKDSRESSTTVRRTYYDDYVCGGDNVVSSFDFTNVKYINNGDGSSNCGVTLTTYTASEDGCGSSKSPYDTSSSTSTCDYFKEDNGDMPTSIGTCTYTRYGYYEYSSKYTCNDAGDEVYLWHFLDSKSCSGDGYKVRTIYNTNATIVCGQGTCSGKYGVYGDCSEYNWDSYYSEAAVPFGKCLPVYSDPDDGSQHYKAYQRPWYYNTSYVFTCNSVSGSGGGSYPSVYYYPSDSDCKGDYTFNFDIYNKIGDSESYKGLDCAYFKVSGCNQGSTVSKDNVPGYSVCSNAFRSIPQFIIAAIAVFALLF